ncbi:MAG: DUF4124 domain-containing protein [Burkholderiales bacterium]
MRLAALALLLAANTAAAQVYKWVDADGVTHYGNHPPPGIGAQPVGDRMNVYQPDETLNDAITTGRNQQRAKNLAAPAAAQPAATPPPDQPEDAGDGATGPRYIQRSAPLGRSSTNIGYPSANNPGTRAGPPR